MSQNYKGLFQDWEIAIATKLAKEFHDKWKCLQKDDVEDLLQECLTHWYFAKDNYESARGASQKTYMGRIIRNKLTDLVRERGSDKRKIAQLAESFDKPLGDDEDSITLIDKVSFDNAPSDPLYKIAQKIDLSRTFQKLTSQQRDICRLLGEQGLSIKEISDCLNTPRSTIYDEINRIKKIFLKEGEEFP